MEEPGTHYGKMRTARQHHFVSPVNQQHVCLKYYKLMSRHINSCISYFSILLYTPGQQNLSTSKNISVASDLYALNPWSTACIRVVNQLSALSSILQKGSLTGLQATLKSVGGTRYTLWEDSGCFLTPLKFIGQ